MNYTVPQEFFQRHRLLPIEETENTMRVGISPSADQQILEDLRLALRKEIIAVEMKQEELDSGLQRFILDSNALEDEENSQEELDVDLSQDLLADVADAPVIRQINSLFLQAMDTRTSDIHIEPYEDFTTVRMRIDGVLVETHQLPKSRHPQLIARLKIMSKLDLAETRRPQDGRLHVHSGERHIDVRVSTVPTIYGERAVMRLLEKDMRLYSLEQLGMVEKDRRDVTDIVSHPYGLFLVTGPTGSGKTTTLYTILDMIRSPQRNIITIEDPVEYRIAGISQIQVNDKVGMTFASGMRSLLRQDPDVMMVGEIRDSETAEIAIQAALTGHLVLSTLHTNDAPTAATRLIDLGIKPYLLSSSLLGAMAQRLVRNLCPHCKKPYTPTAREMHLMGIDKLPADAKCCRPVGCERCNNSGYKGRSGIYEIMTVDEDLRSRITRSEDSRILGKVAHDHGMHTLIEDAIAKVMRGETSVDEALRAARL